MKYKKLLFFGLFALFLIAVISIQINLNQKTKRPLEAPQSDVLNILTFAPQGEELPIFTEGITVMFDRAMIPLTTLDKGRDQKIDVKITPEVSGKFFWLGTHGFIFRPDKPFAPATSYEITLPQKIKAMDGTSLENPVSWKFSTVTPKIIRLSSNSILLPNKASFSIQFNLAMDKSSVERALKITDKKTSRPFKADKKFVWTEDDHLLFVQFTKSLPWETDIEVALPRGIKARQGSLEQDPSSQHILGMKQDESQDYSTPKETFSVEKVSLAISNETLKEEAPLEVGLSEAVCYHFSQPISKDSFEQAFEVVSPPKKSRRPYIYGRHYKIFETPILDGAWDKVEGYFEGCVSFLEEYNQTYTFKVNPEKLASLSGARFSGTSPSYSLKTRHAEPSLDSSLTKNILWPEGVLSIPYSATNLKSAVVRIFPIEKKFYSEEIKSETSTPSGRWDTAGDKFIFDEPKKSLSLGSTKLVLPLDDSAFAIDANRWPPLAEQEISIDEKSDAPVSFRVDLSNIKIFSPLPGLYLIEVSGRSSIANEASPRPVYSEIQITPVALAVKREVDHALVWSTDIESGEPLEGLPIHLMMLDGDGEMTHESQEITDKEGVAVLKTSWDVKEPWNKTVCAEVTKKGMESFTCDSTHYLTNPYQDLLKLGKHYFSYLYTDRPIYRPGQEVFFSSFVREVREGRYFMPYKEMTFEVSAEDSEGEVIYKEEQAKAGPGGVISGKFMLSNSEDIPRGNYYLKIKAGNQFFSKIFVVSSYRKPSFKVEMKADPPEIISQNNLKATVTGNYFFGAPLRRAKVSWSIMTTTHLFSPEGFGNYSFIDDDLLYKRGSEGDSSYYSDYEYEYYDDTEGYGNGEDQGTMDDPRGEGSSESGGDFLKETDDKEVKFKKATLDDKGNFVIQYKPDIKKYPTSQELAIEASVTDPSNQEVATATDVVVHKADFYLGIKPEKWSVGEKEEAKVFVVSLNTAGVPVGRKSFSVDIVKREYQFIERRNARGYWEFLFEPKDTLLQQTSGVTDNKGEASLSYQIPGGGSYRFTLKGKDNQGNEIQSATTVEAWGKGYVPWKLDEPQTIELVADKDSYKIGDTAHILVKSLMPVTKALMTLERGRILDYKVIELGGMEEKVSQQGTESQEGNANHLSIPITEGMIPNIYLSLVAHVGKKENQPPLLFSGQIPLHVEPETKRLSVSLATDHAGDETHPPVYRPGEEVKIHITTKDPLGQPKKGHVMVTVADESVFRLIDYQLPDLIEKFYTHRPNSVFTSSSLRSLKAGDSGGVTAAKKRRLFKDTAHFEANVITDEKGEADFSFKLPDDLTTWVVEALAMTESKTFAEFEKERKNVAEPPAGQRRVDADLNLTDNTFVGGNRAKMLSTLPLLIRPALPRFAAWGDSFIGKIVANNQNPTPVKGTLKVKVSGDGIIKNSNGISNVYNIPFSIKPNSEETFPVELQIHHETGLLIFSAEAASSTEEALDAFEVSIPVLDRYAPEVVASSGMTSGEEKEALDIPSEITGDKGGLEASFKASLGLAAIHPMKTLIDYPYNCSEQRSASLLALLMTKDMVSRYGEKYFDALAPLSPSEIKSAINFDEKIDLVDKKITTIISDLVTKYQALDGGMKYWPESSSSSFYPSVQVLWAFTLAEKIGFTVHGGVIPGLAQYIEGEISTHGIPITLDGKAYGLWGLSLAGISPIGVVEELLKEKEALSVTGLSYLLMAIKNIPMSEAYTEDAKIIASRIASLAKQEPRHTSWPSSGFFWSSSIKNSALAIRALAHNNPADPLVPRGLAFILNRNKVREKFPLTQDNLYISATAYEFSKIMKEEAVNFDALLSMGQKTFLQKSYQQENILEAAHASIPMADLKQLPQPAEMILSKKGEGTLYYDLLLKYYLPPDIAPPREEGLIISREYYSLDDIAELNPLKEFNAGENYKGHITLIVPNEMNYLLLSELLPAGFEPIDMSLATTSRAAGVAASENSDDYSEFDYYSPYDDLIIVEEYGMDYNFRHQEIRDDSIIWAEEYVSPGIYHIRYPVRATTSGTFFSGGATAFEFYEPEIFGRSRPRIVVVK